MSTLKKRVKLGQLLEFIFGTLEHLPKMNHFPQCWNLFHEMLHCLGLFTSFGGIGVSNYLLRIERGTFHYITIKESNNVCLNKKSQETHSSRRHT